ncbi:MAG TPA: OmpA family protein [Salinimicrobium sp.]|nr:OmpA family protein [Salinimicrobium sp.]
MKKLLTVSILACTLLVSCVSKKKYVELEENYNNTRSNLQQTQVEKEALEEKLGAIEARVSDYNAKINSLKDENEQKLEMNDLTAMSNAHKKKMRETLKNVDSEKLKNAKTLEDSINIAVSHNLMQSIGGGENEDIDITVDKTVVMINVSDKLLFRSGSYQVNRAAYPLLEKLAAVINSEPSMEVMIEGHTDNKKIVEGSHLQDNWDLSVRRATAIVRLLQNRFDVAPEKLIAAGRSSFHPLTDNDSAENRAKNRRTRIVILPNLDKFLAMLDSEARNNTATDNSDEMNNTDMDDEMND